MHFVNRQSQNEIVAIHARSRGRLLVVTGARQCGKSTLASMAFPDHPVVNLDAPLERIQYARLGPEDWIRRLPRAIVDEAQKLPEVFETLKACHDRNRSVRYVLLGSSQFLLLKKVSETLAGRVAIRELFPLTLPELTLDRPGEPPGRSSLLELLGAAEPDRAVRTMAETGWETSPLAARARDRWDYFLRWGGMPSLIDPDWSDEDRAEWLADYHATYLQRDLADLARLDRLEPFVRAQTASALRTGQTVNFSELARLSDVSAPTARQFLRYLEISYQVLLLPPWSRNPEKRLAKQPKLHFLDPGIRRAILRKRGAVDGAEFESAVVAEIHKQVRTARLPLFLHHLRTHDGREIDLLVEREDGVVAVECKLSERVSSTDCRHFRGLDELLDRPLLLGLVVSSDPTVRPLIDSPPVWNVPAPFLLGPRPAAP